MPLSPKECSDLYEEAFTYHHKAELERSTQYPPFQQNENGELVPHISIEANTNYAQAYLRFSKAAQAGHADSQYMMGIYSKNKLGVTPKNKDDSEIYFASAAESYKKLAEKKDLAGLYKYGVCYELGHGCPQNIESAIKHYRTVLEVSRKKRIIVEFSIHAAARLALLLHKQAKKEKSQKLFAEAYAAYENVYRMAAFFIEQNKTKKYPPIEQEIRIATYTLGRMAELGQGTDKNLHNAITWYNIYRSFIKNKNKPYRQICKKIAELYSLLSDSPLYVEDKDKPAFKLFIDDQIKFYNDEAAGLSDSHHDVVAQAIITPQKKAQFIRPETVPAATKMTKGVGSPKSDDPKGAKKTTDSATTSVAADRNDNEGEEPKFHFDSGMQTGTPDETKKAADSAPATADVTRNTEENVLPAFHFDDTQLNSSEEIKAVASPIASSPTASKQDKEADHADLHYEIQVGELVTVAHNQKEKSSNTTTLTTEEKIAFSEIVQAQTNESVEELTGDDSTAIPTFWESESEDEDENEDADGLKLKDTTINLSEALSRLAAVESKIEPASTETKSDPATSKDTLIAKKKADTAPILEHHNNGTTHGILLTEPQRDPASQTAASVGIELKSDELLSLAQQSESPDDGYVIETVNFQLKHQNDPGILHTLAKSFENKLPELAKQALDKAISKLKEAIDITSDPEKLENLAGRFRKKFPDLASEAAKKASDELGKIALENKSALADYIQKKEKKALQSLKHVLQDEYEQHEKELASENNPDILFALTNKLKHQFFDLAERAGNKAIDLTKDHSKLQEWVAFFKKNGFLALAFKALTKSHYEYKHEYTLEYEAEKMAFLNLLREKEAKALAEGNAAQSTDEMLQELGLPPIDQTSAPSATPTKKTSWFSRLIKSPSASATPKSATSASTSAQKPARSPSSGPATPAPGSRRPLSIAPAGAASPAKRPSSSTFLGAGSPLSPQRKNSGSSSSAGSPQAAASALPPAAASSETDAPPAKHTM